MANDYFSLGFGFSCPEYLLCFTNAHSEAVEFKTTKHGPYGHLPIGSEIELWYYGDEQYLDPLSAELWYRSGRTLQLTDCQWLSYYENHTSIMLLNGFLDSAGFPLNIDIVNGCEFFDCTESGLDDENCEIDVTLFARKITVYKNETSFDSEDLSGMGAESCIPIGTFPVDDNEDFQPSATVLLNGVVRSVHHLINPATELTYWNVTLDCCGIPFNAVIADDLVDNEIEIGNVIAGYYWLSGKLLKNQ